MLAREARMGERESAALALSRKDGTPDLSVGYMYQQRTGLPDMYGMQFTVNLPSFHRERLRQEVAEGELRVRAAKQGEQARRLEVSYELQQAYSAAQTAKQMVDLYDQAILPQAELARDSAQASYTVGNVDFLTVLTSYTAIYSYELDYQPAARRLRNRHRPHPWADRRHGCARRGGGTLMKHRIRTIIRGTALIAAVALIALLLIRQTRRSTAVRQRRDAPHGTQGSCNEAIGRAAKAHSLLV